MTKPRYEVWFHEDPFYMIISAKTLKSMIKMNTHRHTPMRGFSILREGEEPRGPDGCIIPILPATLTQGVNHDQPGETQDLDHAHPL